LKLENPTNPNIKFYRSPESSTFPGQPGKPIIIDKTENSVTLKWIKSNAMGSSSVIGYTIEMFGRNSTEGWTQVANRVQDTTYEVIGLNSGIAFYFAIRAENSHGMSGPSQLSEPVTIGVVRTRNNRR
jgi:roundabout, axon guidance receptor 2